MLVAGAVSVLSLKNLAQLMIGFVVLQVLVFVVLGVLLIDHSHAGFVLASADYSHHPGAYPYVITAAKGSGVMFGVSLGAPFVTIPFMVLDYVGVLYSYYVGGELRRPGRTYFMAAISLALLVVLWLGFWALLRHTAGLNFMQAQANLGASDPTTYAKISSLDSSLAASAMALCCPRDPITKILLATACRLPPWPSPSRSWPLPPASYSRSGSTASSGQDRPRQRAQPRSDERDRGRPDRESLQDAPGICHHRDPGRASGPVLHTGPIGGWSGGHFHGSPATDLVKRPGSERCPALVWDAAGHLAGARQRRSDCSRSSRSFPIRALRGVQLRVDDHTGARAGGGAGGVSDCPGGAQAPGSLDLEMAMRELPPE